MMRVQSKVCVRLSGVSVSFLFACAPRDQNDSTLSDRKSHDLVFRAHGLVRFKERSGDLGKYTVLNRGA